MRNRLLAAVLFVAPVAAAQNGRPDDILALRRLLVAHEFVRLDAAMSARRSEARQTPANEMRHVYAYDAFSVDDSTLRPHFDAWVAQQPASAHARIARGGFFVNMAVKARGKGWASETKDEQVERMMAWLRLAMADASAAAHLDSSDVMAYSVVLNAVRFAGANEDGQRAVERALAIEPATLSLRALRLGSLRPRWGGSQEEMDAFAQAAQAHVTENPRLRVLLGYSAWDRGEELMEDDQYQAAIVEYTKALSYGDFWRYRAARGWLYVKMHHPEKGLVDLNRAIAERPGYAESLAKRAIAYAILAHPKEGAESDALLGRGRDDLALATALDPAEDFVVWTRKSYPALIRPTKP